MSRALMLFVLLAACMSLGNAIKCYYQRETGPAVPVFEVDPFEPHHAETEDCGPGYYSCITQRAQMLGTLFTLRACDQRHPTACENYGSEPNMVCLCGGDLCNGRMNFPVAVAADF